MIELQWCQVLNALLGMPGVVEEIKTPAVAGALGGIRVGRSFLRVSLVQELWPLVHMEQEFLPPATPASCSSESSS